MFSGTRSRCSSDLVAGVGVDLVAHVAPGVRPTGGLVETRRLTRTVVGVNVVIFGGVEQGEGGTRQADCRPAVGLLGDRANADNPLAFVGNIPLVIRENCPLILDEIEHAIPDIGLKIPEYGRGEIDDGIRTGCGDFRPADEVRV